MNKVCVISAVTLLAVVGVVLGAVPPSGKCNTRNITPISIDPKSLLTIWDILYVTNDGKTTDSLDHVSYAIRADDENTMKVVSAKVLKDKSTDTQKYSLSVVDDVLLEDAIDNDKPTHFHIYPLAKSNEGALLLYRCADASRLPVDTRVIAIPRGKSLSDEGLRELQKADAGYKFKGELVKLPYQLTQSRYF